MWFLLLIFITTFIQTQRSSRQLFWNLEEPAANFLLREVLLVAIFSFASSLFIRRAERPGNE